MDHEAEKRRLKPELTRVTEERDILKKQRRTSRARPNERSHLNAFGSSPIARAVVESFFRLFKRERIRRRTYPTREAARQGVDEYIKMFCNPKRKHTNNGLLTPVVFETRQRKLNQAGG